MKRRPQRRLQPSLDGLEPRYLLSETGISAGQNGADYVGMSTIPYNPANPQDSRNEYQDIDIFIDGIPQGAIGPDGKNTKLIDKVNVKTLYDEWSANSPNWAAYPLQDLANHNVHIFVEPSANDAKLEVGSGIFNVVLNYHDGTSANVKVPLTQSIDPNLRMPGTELSAQWIGQDEQDWAGPTASVGPDGVQDFHIRVSNISPKSTFQSLLLIANPGTSSALAWEAGTNSYWNWPAETDETSVSNAEPFDLGVQSNGLNALDFYANPVTNQRGGASLNPGAPLILRINYTDTKRSGKTDLIPVSAGLTARSVNPSLSMPAVSVPISTRRPRTAPPRTPRPPATRTS